MLAINNLKRDKEDAIQNEKDETMKKMRIDIADSTIWTLYREIQCATNESSINK